MANKLYEESHIQNIANAIRGKTGKSDKMKVSQMASEIGGISTKSDIKLQEKTASQNGTVTADSGYDGLSKVHVSVPDKTPKLQDKTITENGTYQADNGYDALRSVTVEVASSGGIEDGYNVEFCADTGDKVAFYSIVKGLSIPTAPSYDCSRWQLEDGTPILFPLTPTENMTLYANNESALNSLWEYYGMDKAVYPYVAIGVSADKNTIKVGFGNTTPSTSTQVTMTFGGGKNYNERAGLSSVLSTADLTNANAIIDIAKSYITNMQYEQSSIFSNLCAIYTNFEHNYKASEVTMVI